MPKTRTHAYFQTHWDREWYEPFPLYQQRLAEVVKTILTLLNHSETTLPRFTLDGQTALLTDVQPLLTAAEKEALRQHLASGRLHVGPWFVMPDTVLVSAESLIRNLQLGIQTANHYGCTHFTGYLPDTFGQPSSLPALFQGMGIETAIVWRGRGMAGQASAFFQWESPNGQSVLAYQLAEGYFHLFLQDETLSIPEKMTELDSLVQTLGRFSADEPFLLPLGGDHLGPPKSDVLEAFHQHLPTASVVHPHQFMETAQRWLLDSKTKVPTHQGSLRAVGSQENNAPFLLTGTLSARMALKLANAKLEHRLTHQTERQLAWLAMAHPEKLATIGWEFSLNKAWELLLLNHPHDSICGCSLDEVHRTNHVRFDESNAYAEALERRTQVALGLNQTGIHGWNGSTVAVSGVLPLTLTLDKKTPTETEAEVFERLSQAFPQCHWHTVQSDLVDAYKTDFRQVPLSHLTQWQAIGWITIAPEKALPALSVVNNYPHPSLLPQGEGTFVAAIHDSSVPQKNHHETPFFKMTWTTHSFEVASVPLPSYRIKADVGDSYNRQPSTDVMSFVLQQVAVDYQTPQATQWQLQYQTTEGDCLTQTILCLIDEPVLTIETAFTPNRPFIAVELVLAENQVPQRIKGYQQLGWEEASFTVEGLIARQQAFPVATPQDEWEALGGIFQAGLQTPTHFLWQAGCYAYEVEEGAVIVPLHRGFGVLSGGKMPVRGCPAGPPFETPEGQGMGNPLRFEGLWGATSVLDEQLPLVQKAKARLLGDVGFKGHVLSESGKPQGAFSIAENSIRLWEVQTEIPAAIELQACYPKSIEGRGEGLIFRWLNASHQAVRLPLPNPAVLWQCHLIDDPLEQIPSSVQELEIAPFSWLTLWRGI